MILIAGPCVIEGRDFLLKMAARLEKFAHLDGVEFYFKSSFDKANRTSISSFRGPGLERGCEILAEVKREFGYRLLTDIHEPAQAAVAAQVVDMLQIPAFLCRQTDLVVAAAKTGAKINIKKGQFLSADAMRHIVVKALQARAGAGVSGGAGFGGAGVLGGAGFGGAAGGANSNLASGADGKICGENASNSNLAACGGAGENGADNANKNGANFAGGASENLREITPATLTRELARRHGICVCERGNSFGYGNLVVDMRNLAIMREFAPVIFDATHSVQMPAGAATTGGDSRFVPLLARSAAAAGVDGFFYETHIAPREALSDGANMLDLAAFEASLDEVMRVREALGERG